MIDYFFGKPRTGKSYRAIKIIYDEYIKENKELPKYTNLLTNVGGFKFDLVNRAFSDKGYHGLAYKLVWKSFYKHLQKLHEMALDEKSDEELNRYADYHKINDCLIIIDEASLYFKKYDDVLSWWLAYHGHFKIRIILIAQSPKQINAEYLVHSEIFYEAQPQAKQLRNDQLRYIHHSEVPFNKDSKFSHDTIKTSQDIYDLYKSGEVDKPKKIIYKYIFIMIGAILFLILIIKYFFSSIESRAGLDETTQQAKQELTTNQSIDTNLNEFILVLRCNELYCWNTDDKYQNKVITLKYFKSLAIKLELKLIYEEVSNEIFYLRPFQNTYSKTTVAKLTDYHYFISKDLKNTYLHKLFIPKEQEKKSLQINNTFNPLKEENEYFQQVRTP